MARDAAMVSDLVRTIEGPVVLVGHSYGGAVISNAQTSPWTRRPDVRHPGPVAQTALEEPSGPAPLWRHVPSYFVIAGEDRNIPAALQRALAERATA